MTARSVVFWMLVGMLALPGPALAAGGSASGGGSATIGVSASAGVAASRMAGAPMATARTLMPLARPHQSVDALGSDARRRRNIWWGAPSREPTMCNVLILDPGGYFIRQHQQYTNACPASLTPLPLSEWLPFPEIAN